MSGDGVKYPMSMQVINCWLNCAVIFAVSVSLAAIK